MTNILLNTVNEISEKELETLGKASAKCKDAGAHLVTIKKVYTKATETYQALTIELETADEEELRIFQFMSTPKDDSAEAINKAEAGNKRVMAMLNRLAKAAGLKDAKQALAGAVAESGEKGETTNFPKLVNKKLTVISFTEIQTDKDDKKAYAVQEVDTFNFLTKEGKDGLGREVAERLGEAAKTKVEMQYDKESLPIVLAKYTQTVERLAGGTPSATTAPVTVAASAVSDSDI